MMHAMFGRALGVCGWLAWQVRRPFGHRSAPRAAAPYAVATLLLLVAAAPIAVPLLDPQPQDVTVEDIREDRVAEPTGWVRLRGEVVPLDESPTGEPGAYALLVDESDTLQAIVVAADEQPEAAASTTVIGRVVPAIALVDQVPFEATVYGAPPEVVGDRVVELDAVPKPERSVWWPLSIVPLSDRVLNPVRERLLTRRIPRAAGPRPQLPI